MSSEMSFGGKVVVSIAAGITLAQLHDMIGGSPKLVLRAMPNVPCRIQQGVTAVSVRDSGDAQAEEIGRRLF